MNHRVLVIEDDQEMRLMLVDRLGARGFSVAACATGAEAFPVLDREPIDAVVTDLNVPGMKGTEICARLAEERADIPVIVITAFGSLDTAVGAIRAGAYDFITKPLKIEELALALERGIQHRLLREEVKRLRGQVARSQGFGEFIGASPAMQRVYDLIDQVADADTRVLITGESGTGKELVARALHQRSRRAKGPFVAINCGALTESLLESELFGHVKGAFTDAKAARSGLLVQASGGTLFLDEIGDMPLAVQVKLLRALETRCVRPVGSDTEIAFDVRLVAATNRDLEERIEEGLFREDLYYRINVIHIPLPPLRARGNDVLLIAQNALKVLAERSEKPVAGLSSGAAEKLLAYAWPGNVRELQNCIERAVAVTHLDQLTVDNLPERIRNHAPLRFEAATGEGSGLLPLEDVERNHILRVLSAVGGNKTRAAEILGCERRTLYRKLERYGVLGND